MTGAEAPKRLAPLPETKRWLYLLSGNECAFPSCTERLLNSKGDWIGEHVHIHGVKGERFDPEMSNEDRRHRDNLLLMCHAHHVETNDEEEWTADRLRHLKQEHEARFLRGIESYTLDPLPQDIFDLTRGQPVRHAESLTRMHAVLDWPYDADDAAVMIDQTNGILDRLRQLTPNCRAVLGTIIDRAERGRRGPFMDDMYVLWSELRDVLNLTDERLTDFVAQLDRSGWASVDVEDGLDVPGATVHASPPDPDWTAFWLDLRDFLVSIDGGRFAADVLVDLDMSVLDS